MVALPSHTTNESKNLWNKNTHLMYNDFLLNLYLLECLENDYVQTNPYW